MAQTNSLSLFGVVKTPNGQPVPFATVTLVALPSKNLTQSTLADDTGAYKLVIDSPGTYQLIVTQVGMEPVSYMTVRIVSTPVELNVQIKEAVQALAEVQVRGQKPFIEQTLDRTIVHVENSPAGSGTTAIEVLKRAPGVSVDENGTLSFNGKSPVLVLIDGQTSYLSAAQLYQLLKTMPSSQLARLELLANPSAKYDAAGSAGVIDIRLKKEQRTGLNGVLNLSYGQGRYAKHNSGGSLSLRQGNWEVALSYDYGYNKNYYEFIQRRRFGQQKSGLLSVFEQYALYQAPSHTHTAKGRLAYSPNRRLTIGASLDGVDSRELNIGRNATRILDGMGRLDSGLVTTDHTVMGGRTMTANLHGKLSIDTAGRELTANVNYAYYDQTNTQLFTTQYSDAQQRPTHQAPPLRVESPSLIRIWTANVDYVHPAGKWVTVEAGLKVSSVTTHNNAQFFISREQVDVLDTERSNYFIYEESILSGYGQLNRVFGKLRLQVGMRAEQTGSLGRQLSSASSFRRHYLRLFPSALLSYTLSDQHALGLQYSRRIDRPSYASLNPFAFILDPYTFHVGNPGLQPQFTQAIDVTHRWKDNVLMTTLSYSRTTDVMSEVLQQDAARRITLSTTANLQALNSYGLSATINVSPARWWTISGRASLRYNRYQSDYLSSQLTNRLTTWSASTTQTLSLPKQFSVELTGSYRSAMASGIGVQAPIGMMSVGATKTVWARKATFRILVSDVFKTDRTRKLTRYETIDVSSTFRGDNTVFTAAFTYQFGRSNSSSPLNRRLGIEEETSRVH
ncbi:outer membrane beta-barrel family protein [Spirosoma knui]